MDFKDEDVEILGKFLDEKKQVNQVPEALFAQLLRCDVDALKQPLAKQLEVDGKPGTFSQQKYFAFLQAVGATHEEFQAYVASVAPKAAGSGGGGAVHHGNVSIQNSALEKSPINAHTVTYN